MKAVLGASVFVESPGGTGSGVVVSPDGWVLTAAHVVSGQTEVKVRTRTGTAVPGRLVAMDVRQDVALMRAKGDTWACLPLAKAPAEVGDELYAIGSPFGEAFEFSLSKGIVSGVADRCQLEPWQQRGAAGRPGGFGFGAGELEGGRRGHGRVGLRRAGGRNGGEAFAALGGGQRGARNTLRRGRGARVGSRR
ncbi:MAG: serine protease [Myxococcales bacterium]|nr:serine protease [Myxococcales bacterium]